MMFIMSIMVMNEIKEKNDNEDKSREVEVGDENSGIRDACSTAGIKDCHILH